jgi:hypothetical protein
VRRRAAAGGIAVLDTATDRATGAIWWDIGFLLFPLLGFSQAFRDLISS